MLGLRAVSHEPSCNCSNFVGVDMGQGGDNHRDQKARQALSTSIFCFILTYHNILLQLCKAYSQFTPCHALVAGFPMVMKDL